MYLYYVSIQIALGFTLNAVLPLLLKLLDLLVPGEQEDVFSLGALRRLMGLVGVQELSGSQIGINHN